jgi:hypothetical protein
MIEVGGTIKVPHKFFRDSTGQQPLMFDLAELQASTKGTSYEQFFTTPLIPQAAQAQLQLAGARQQAQQQANQSLLELLEDEDEKVGATEQQLVAMRAENQRLQQQLQQAQQQQQSFPALTLAAQTATTKPPVTYSSAAGTLAARATSPVRKQPAAKRQTLALPEPEPERMQTGPEPMQQKPPSFKAKILGKDTDIPCNEVWYNPDKSLNDFPWEKHFYHKYDALGTIRSKKLLDAIKLECSGNDNDTFEDFIGNVITQNRDPARGYPGVRTGRGK